MESRSTNRMMVFLIIVLFGVAIFGAVRYINFSKTLEDNPWQNYKADLLARAHSDVLDAHKLWNAQRVPHYLLTIQRTALDGKTTCQQNIEVKDETVATTYQDTCTTATTSFAPASPNWKPPTPPFEATVSQLFATAERDTGEITWTSEGVGCHFYRLDMTFDPQKGYPSRIAYQVDKPPDTMGFPVRAEYFRAGEPTPGPSCASAIVGGPTIAAQVTPMQ